MNPINVLQRFCYLGTLAPVYHRKKGNVDPKYITELMPLLSELDSETLHQMINKCIVLHKSMPRKQEVWFVYALYLASTVSQENKNKAKDNFSKYAINTEDLFLFANNAFIIMKFQKKNNLSKTVRKAITKWYLSKSSNDLVEMLATHRGMHGITHKDLINICHIHFKPEQSNIVKGFFARCSKIVEKNSREKLTAPEKKLKEYCELKICENPLNGKSIVENNKMNIEKVPTHLLHKLEVWEALLPNLSYHQLFKIMHSLTDNKILNNKNFSRSFGRAIGNKETQKSANLHPIILLMEKNKHIQLIPYSENVKRRYYKKKVERLHIQSNSFLKKQLNTIFESSFEHNKSIGVRMFITINLQENYKTKVVINQKQISCMEGAITLALSYFRSEKNAQVYSFGPNSLKPITWTKDCSYKKAFEICNSNLEKRNLQRSYLPIVEALKKKDVFDLFLIIVPSIARGNPGFKPDKLIEKLNEYRKDKNKKAKMVILNLRRFKEGMQHQLSTSNGILEICGLFEDTPRIINAFASNLFD